MNNYLRFAIAYALPAFAGWWLGIPNALIGLTAILLAIVFTNIYAENVEVQTRISWLTLVIGAAVSVLMLITGVQGLIWVIVFMLLLQAMLSA